MSGESALRNAVKRVTHKERSQPAFRKKLGGLEKHKDYVVRSKDYKKKRNAIKYLKQKASGKNPDEFYFGMHNAKLKKGIHTEAPTSSLSTKEAFALKTQDMGHIYYQKSINDRLTRSLSSSLHSIGDFLPSSHKLFISPSDTDALENIKLSEHFRTDERLVGRTHNRLNDTILSRQSTLDQDHSSEIGSKSFTGVKSDKSYKELESRTNLSKKLKSAIINLNTHKGIMGRGSKKKMLNNESKTPLYKWKRQRAK